MSNIIETVLWEVDNEDDNLEMLDGSVWFVTPGDLPNVVLWLPTSAMVIEDMNDNSMFPYKITNKCNESTIRAMKIC